MRGFILVLFLGTSLLLNAQNSFDQYFTNGSLRFDFLLGGNVSEVKVYPEQIKKEPYWGGSQNNLVDTFNYGSYRFQVFDAETDSLLFRKGFSTLFQEWQTTTEAKITDKTYYQAVIFPFPRNTVKLKIETRQRNGEFKSIYSTLVDPEDYFILDERIPYEVVDIVKNGPSEYKVDIVFLGDGYAQQELDKLIVDAKKLAEYLLTVEPFKTEKENFNIKTVLVPSLESGTDVPGQNIYRNTHFNSTFYTFDLARYLTSSDMKSIYDAASVTAYDQIYLLVNSDRYGGGGFYNLLGVSTANHENSLEVFVHEFGHSFAGLGDEYYTSSVAYEDFYNLEVEPWEPNLTTLVNFDSKWNEMIHDSIPVPTPRQPKYQNAIGVFEGGGYLRKGIYSPQMDCRMKSNKADGFCPVCQDAIRKMIHFYTK